MKKRFIYSFIILMFGIMIFSNSVYAENLDFWGNAIDWFKEGQYTNNENVNEIISTFKSMINVLGTTVITLVTMMLGIKYMYGSVEAKASVKESLVTLIVACVFFFGWTGISNLLFPDNNFIFIKDSDATFADVLGRIFSIATYIANFFAIGGIIYVGVKYIFAGASGKADLKGKSGQFLIGIILAFCTVNFLTYISNIVQEVLSTR